MWDEGLRKHQCTRAYFMFIIIHNFGIFAPIMLELFLILLKPYYA